MNPPRKATILLLKLALDDLLLLLRLLLLGADKLFGVGRQRLQEIVEPLTVFVGERAEFQPVVVLSFALDDGVCAICGDAHVELLCWKLLLPAHGLAYRHRRETL